MAVAVTIREEEAEPTDYPSARWEVIREDYVDGDPTVEPTMTWRRIESWIAYRWRPRSVEFFVEGPGVWESRLTPFFVSEILHEDGGTAEFTQNAFGNVRLTKSGVYRIKGVAGENVEPPEDVLEAWSRLHNYFIGIAASHRNETAFVQEEDMRAVPSWAGKAIQLSGAADLLRRYRRLAA